MTAKRQAKKQKAKAAEKQKSRQTKARTATPKAGKKEPVKEKKQFEVEFYRDWCKGCGICAAFCPAGALSINDKGEPEITKPELCTGCTWCE
ncbi:MAG: 4Fe-4S binding protein, partial [Deltaproteobacteria bacterium]